MRTDISETLESLKALQRLDAEIADAERRVEDIEPRLAELEAPAHALEVEAEAARTRIREMRMDERRLERVADEKRQRLRQLEERLNLVRNVREEAAVRAEIDLVRRAAETDEQEALELLDQIRRTEVRLQELEGKLESARGEIGPQRQAFLEVQRTAQEQLAILRDRRANHAVRIGAAAREAYERVRSGRTRMAVAVLTEDGACGHCFSVVPLQRQWEIRRGAALIHCEACGVILAPPDSP
ncbi:MAG: hypothetical protein HY704_17650 [Gemmatimonadetes bacterium]|nr:hypothetical protein [Gemmatimonadota bacterium]